MGEGVHILPSEVINIILPRTEKSRATLLLKVLLLTFILAPLLKDRLSKNSDAVPVLMSGKTEMGKSPLNW